MVKGNTFLRNNSKYISVSPALQRNPYLSGLLGSDVEQVNFLKRRITSPRGNVKGVLAWGRKPSAIKAERYACRNKLPLLRIEDAFLRSLELGASCPPLGIVTDDLGIYYDARSQSKLEEQILKPLTEEERERAEKLIKLWRKLRLSKYNFHREQSIDYKRAYVLITDQTAGDASIDYGLASATSFERMLHAAREKFPQHLLVIKTHPDVVAGFKQGHFSHDSIKAIDDSKNVILEGRSIPTPGLIQKADAVFCVTSQVGFEALIWGKPVYTFGMPFYAGYGLTHDDLPAPERRQNVSLYQLIYAAFIRYARYWHPERQSRCEIEDLMDWIAMQRSRRSEFPEKLLSERFPRWKRKYLKQFFDGTKLEFLSRADALPSKEEVVIWGRSDQVNRICVEDGFIRSVGLGADLTAPKSWVIDDTGMYYDATRPSRLEVILNEANFSSCELLRAERLAARIVDEQVSKYNIGVDSWKRPANVEKVILVPGQVETDASIRFGSPYLKSNFELLKEVREKNPNAHVIYKPHPDIVAGLRKKDTQLSKCMDFCDQIVIHDNMASLLKKLRHTDEVHTMTSLTGFEALLREIPVSCYGQPFYSGWGLTTDYYPNSRRTKKRSLNELVFATLIAYPRYLSAKSGCLTSPEQALNEIAEERIQLGNARNVWREVAVKTLKRLILRLKRF